MLRLLLDAHIARAVARRLQAEGIDAMAVQDWLRGDYRSAADDALLQAASEDWRTHVSYDCRTLPSLLKEWAETGRSHSGVILVDERTVRQSDVGGLLHALRVLVAEAGDDDWTNRVIFLRAGSGRS